ncbi:DUF4019 domain-containing protein [Herbaspirillum autotrophicum]|uniref:DUF4019 domain-containing protein n=1 Tax=Herbaspirillum autotrophicum TaxID=180195 RepID=UPI00067AEE18|nr:DUF4019 domain-containing protein [Herbaspirillum autotrophicum]
MATFESLKKIGNATMLALATGLAVSPVSPVAAQTPTSVDTALAVATQWALLADSSQGERMWNVSGPVMQKNVPKDEWNRYLAALHGELGRVAKREWVQIVRISNPANLPPGEYVNVVFSSRFSNAPTVEKVSLTQSGGRWIPVGYVVNRVESSPAPAAAPPLAR